MYSEQALLDTGADRMSGLPSDFVCSWTDGGVDAVWMHVAGELDVAAAPRLDLTLRDPQLQARLVVLDLRDLTFMDGAGLHTIVSASDRARRGGGRLVLLRGPPNVSRVFDLAERSAELEMGDIDSAEPSTTALLRLAEQDLL
jgi:anti-anti-sigma factor